MTPIRIFTTLAAVFLVTAIALGSLLPPDQPLSQILAETDSSYLPALQSFELQRLGGWAWVGITVPLLVRPIWLLPLFLGIVCLGLVATLNWRTTRPTQRRRS